MRPHFGFSKLEGNLKSSCVTWHAKVASKRGKLGHAHTAPVPTLSVSQKERLCHTITVKYKLNFMN